MKVAIGTVLGAIGLSFVLAFVASWIGGDAEGVAYVVGMLVGLPAFLLLLPVLILAAGLDYAGRRAYPGKPIVASWDVRLDGEAHVVSLPVGSASSPDHVWVDGARMPLEWTQDRRHERTRGAGWRACRRARSPGERCARVCPTLRLGAGFYGAHRGWPSGPLHPRGRSGATVARHPRQRTGNADPRRATWNVVALARADPGERPVRIAEHPADLQHARRVDRPVDVGVDPGSDRRTATGSPSAPGPA